MAFNFGSSGFPAASTSAASTSFGLGAGTTTANKPSFGSSAHFQFGPNAPSLYTSGTTPGTGFGSLTSSAPSTGFGGLTSSAPSTGFGGLTSSAPSTGFGSLKSAAPTATGFGGFGGGFGVNTSTATTTTLTSGTSFGTGTGFTGFGTAPTTSTQSGFGGFGSFSQPATSSAPLFPGFGQPAANTGFGQPAANTGFGQPAANTGFGGFGSTFGAKPGQTMTSGGFGGFGTSSFGGGLQQQQQPQQQVAQNPNEALYNSIFHCAVYGDERDTVLSRWNLLQALWGTGKAYYSNNAAPVDITQQNPFCRFKAVGYSTIPASENKDGLVAIVFNKSEAEIKAQQQQLVASLNTVLGNKPSLVVTVDSIKPMSETKAQVVIYVQERTATGSVRRIPVPELTAFLLQPMQKQQLTSMCADNVFAHAALDKETVQSYLDNPPAGIDPRLWKQAQLDNPDPGKFLPVPMVGFSEVRWRMRCQEQETRQHQAFLDRVADDIAQLRTQQSNTGAKITEYRRKFVELQHRVLRVLVQQEVRRKMGMALQPEEEMLRSQLEALESQLNAPTQFKGRLNEMLSQMRMQRQEAAHHEVERYAMDPAMQENVKQFLTLEQNGMAHLIDTVQADLASLNIIKEGMTRLLQGH